MTRTIIVSSTLKVLSIEDVTTSSQAYELQLGLAFSHIQSTTVVSLTALDDAQYEGLNLVALKGKPRGIRAALNLTKELLREQIRGVQVIAFGYDPLIILPLMLSRALGAAAYAVVFDTHLGTSERLTPTKRVLVNTYFGLGRQLLRALSGLFVVTKDAEDIFTRLNGNVFRTRIGFDGKRTTSWSRPASEGFNVIYAGALEVYNGVQQMMDGVILRNKQNESMRPVVLNVYGTGSLQAMVESYATRYEAIAYHGVAAKAIVDKAVLESHLAFNLRDLRHPVSVNAFPSKLIELLGLGVPVASTAVLPSAVLSKYALIITGVNAESVMEALSRAENCYEALIKKTLLARRFVATEYDWHVVVSQMLGFMGSGHRRGGAN